MNTNSWRMPGAAAVCAAAMITGAWAMAQDKEAGQPAPQLPPGWTQADMEACVAAGTPGKMQAHLAKGAGAWTGKCSMWMHPGAEPMKGECAAVATVVMDGRFVRVEMTGDFPGMGPYRGLGFHGFDNVSKKFVSNWLDNHSTGMMRGEGNLSDDGKVLTWEYAFSCPLTQKPAVMREVETITGEHTKTLESFMTDPKSGKEYRMMRIEFSRKEK